MGKVNFSSSQPREMPVEFIQPSTPPSWGFLATLFFTDLLAPPVEMCQKAFHQVRQDGTFGTLRRMGRALQKHPLDAFVLAGSLALGFCPSIAEKSVLIPTTLGTAAAVRNSRMFTEIAKTVNGQTLIEQGVKLSCYAIVIYMVSSVPVTAAYDTLSETRAAYSGGPCDDSLDSVVDKVLGCLIEGNSIEECHRLAPQELKLDHQVFTRHSPGEIVSSVEIHNGGKVCFLTADKQSAVTKTCFPTITDPSKRTIEKLPEMTLARAQEGLEIGDSVLHVAVHREEDMTTTLLQKLGTFLRLMGDKKARDWLPKSSDCGGFRKTSETTQLSEKAICLLTALHPQGPVTQTCFDPANPSHIIAKTTEGIEMDFQPDGNPVLVVVRNPTLFGLNPSADSSSDSSDQCELECKCR